MKSSQNLVKINRRLFSAIAISSTLSACGGGSSDVDSSLPKITVQPADAANMATTSVTFFVALGSEVGVSFQWVRDGLDISGATQKTLTLTGLRQ